MKIKTTSEITNEQVDYGKEDSKEKWVAVDDVIKLVNKYLKKSEKGEIGVTVRYKNGFESAMTIMKDALSKTK